MDLGKIALFDMMKKRFAWLAQRQEVLAHNIANADTPGFNPSDIEPFKFERLVKSTATKVNMTMSDADHLGGQRQRIAAFDAKETRRPYETSPSGNAVVIEEQMMKIGATATSHKLTTELYKKHLGMIRTALGRR